MSWSILWQIFLILTLGLYSILVVVVLFGGIKDIKEMFKDLISGEESE
jgi:hypothetical protein